MVITSGPQWFPARTTTPYVVFHLFCLCLCNVIIILERKEKMEERRSGITERAPREGTQKERERIPKTVFFRLDFPSLLDQE